MFERLHAIVFCGTPHRGSDYASWGSIASSILSAFLQDSGKRLLSNLEVDDQVLDMIHSDFLRLLHGDKILIHSFQEGRGLSSVKGFSGKVLVT
jgi:hypothetical protein